MSTPLVVPAGVVFDITDAGVRIENEGAVELHTDFGGRRILRLSSGEGVLLGAPDNQADELLAAGALVVRGRLHGGHVAVEGDLDADELVVDSLRVGGNARVVGALRAGDAQVAGSLSAGSLRATSVRVGGDLRVDHDLGATSLEVGGAIEVGGNLTFDVLDLPGTVRLAGDLQGRTLRADVIELTGSAVNVRGIQARTRVVIGAARLTVDAVIAPEVVIDRGATGRVTVVESQNDLGQVPIKGGFRLADYAEMFGDPAAFLAERGLVALGAAPAAVAAVAEAEPVAEAVAEPVAEPEDALEASEASEEDEANAQASVESTDDVVSVNLGRPTATPAWSPTVESTPEAPAEPEAWSPTVESTPEAPAEPEAWSPTAESAAEAPAEPEAQVEPDVQVEPEPEPPVTAIEPSVEAVAAAPDPEPIAADDPLAAAAEHPMHPQLASTVQRIVDCYQDAELPPAVDRLRGLVDERRYTDIRAEITNIWSELLKYHQKKGIRIHHQVTTTFNSVNSLVKKM